MTHGGYPLENRTYNAIAIKYDFTGKERDNETSYDYFGARYYDSRIGRWGGVELLLNKYIDVTPYCYSLNNPLVLVDPNGKDPRRNHMANLNEIVDKLNQYKGATIEDFAVKEMSGNESPRYLYTESDGFVDLLHFFYSSRYYS